MREQYSALDSVHCVGTALWEQGFIDQFGAFHDREEALRIVKRAFQPFSPERNGSETQLFSEGLY